MKRFHSHSSLFFLFFFLLCSLPSVGQTRAFDSRVQSLLVTPTGTEQLRLYPYYRINSGEGVQISFDLMGDESMTLGYRLQHCGHDWQASPISPADAVSGFLENEFDPPAVSRATLVNYVHYELSLPNANCTPKLSGNYLLTVFDVYDPDEILLTAAFRVVAPLASLKGGQTSVTYEDVHGRHQQVNVEADLKGLRILSPSEELTLVVGQNGRESGMLSLTRPSSIAGNIITYDQHAGALFPATNVYRKAEMLSDSYNGMGVYRSYSRNGHYVMELYPDKNRARLPYQFEQNNFGRRIIRSTDSPNGATEGDYYEVIFSFESEKLPGQVLLSGQAFDFLPISERELFYDASEQMYTRTLMMKQGYFNYLYILHHEGDSLITQTALTEGNHYETENRYTVFLYAKTPADIYESLIAVLEIK
ncbi:DUF5103 domain-containing protein [Porphyromonas gulae]|uniref:type IX secretion system plug protein n=1 Tax=Porphyromonas gulae TaxID=111105 RepID=UPI0026EF264F|nr:DUF5103 domain-containing protein [Porphyromonas gulae]